MKKWSIYYTLFTCLIIIDRYDELNNILTINEGNHVIHTGPEYEASPPGSITVLLLKSGVQKRMNAVVRIRAAAKNIIFPGPVLIMFLRLFGIDNNITKNMDKGNVNLGNNLLLYYE